MANLHYQYQKIQQAKEGVKKQKHVGKVMRNAQDLNGLRLDLSKVCQQQSDYNNKRLYSYPTVLCLSHTASE